MKQNPISRYSMRNYNSRLTTLAVSAGSIALLGALGACAGGESPPNAAGTATAAASATAAAATEWSAAQASTAIVKDTMLPNVFAASGTAQPIQQATLSTRLMASVTAVLVQEGDRVSEGQVLVRLDARDLAAREAQVSAGVESAEAMHEDALRHASRIRALFADSAATRVQLEAAESGLTRAEAGVRAARAAGGELSATTAYATIRAPFAGIVTRRFVDPGAFAAPGAPLVSLQDASRLRVSATAAPDVVHAIRRGQTIPATIEGQPVTATVEGVVPADGGNIYRVNALVQNPMEGSATRTFLAGSAATLELASGSRPALVVPAAAIMREGDLTGVMLRTDAGDELRWVRLGNSSGDMIEVTSGLRAGDRVVLPAGSSAPAGTGQED